MRLGSREGCSWRGIPARPGRDEARVPVPCSMKRSRTVFETRSAQSGRIRVVDYRAERRLLVSGDTLSVYPLDGDWTRLRREYWWRALKAVPLPPRPSTLLVGLGGGTQLHLIQTLRRPGRITVIERDPAIIRIAADWFGLHSLGRIEFLCADAAVAASTLAVAR